MFNTKHWMGWATLAGLSAGCGPQPQPAAPHEPVLVYRLQGATVAWGGPAPSPGDPYDRWRGNQGQPRGSGDTSTSGWGRHYPWRGPGQPPAWYGHVERHVPDSYVLIGDFYYPYYLEGGVIYPVYSMPYVFSDDDLVPRYGALPPFGPVQVQPNGAHTLHRERGHHR